MHDGCRQSVVLAAQHGLLQQAFPVLRRTYKPAIELVSAQPRTCSTAVCTYGMNLWPPTQTPAACICIIHAGSQPPTSLLQLHDPQVRQPLVAAHATKHHHSSAELRDSLGGHTGCRAEEQAQGERRPRQWGVSFISARIGRWWAYLFWCTYAECIPTSTCQPPSHLLICPV